MTLPTVQEILELKAAAQETVAKWLEEETAELRKVASDRLNELVAKDYVSFGSWEMNHILQEDIRAAGYVLTRDKPHEHDAFGSSAPGWTVKLPPTDSVKR